MYLYEALKIKKNRSIAIIGSGGKTSIIYRLADELSIKGRILVTTTTKMFYPEENKFNVCITDCINQFNNFIDKSSNNKPFFLAKSVISNNKVEGISSRLADLLITQNLFDYILIEADGAMNKSLKYHDFYEPVIPMLSKMIIICVGIDCINKEFNSNNVHRANLAIESIGISLNTIIKPYHVVKCIKYCLTNKKHMMENKKKVLLINKVEDDSDIDAATEIGAQLRQYFDEIIISSLRNKRWYML